MIIDVGNALNLLNITSRAVHFRGADDRIDFDELSVVSICCVLLVLVKESVVEWVIFRIHRRRGWKEHLSALRWLDRVRILGTMVLLFMLFAGLCDAPAELQGSDVTMRVMLAFCGGILWLNVLLMLCCIETKNVGQNILPIIAALGDVFGILVVMFFCVCSFTQIFYALSGETFSAILYACYELGVFKKPVPEMGGPDYSTIPWRQMASSLTGLLMLWMGSIFVGNMVRAYQEHKQHVVSDFVSARAHVVTDYLLLKERWPSSAPQERGQHRFLWFCQRDDGAEEEPAGHEAEEEAAAAAAAPEEKKTAYEKRADGEMQEKRVDRERPSSPADAPRFHVKAIARRRVLK